MKYLYWYIGGVIGFTLFLKIISNAPQEIKNIVVFLIISSLVYFCSMMLFTIVIEAVFPNMSKKVHITVSLLIAISFGVGAVLFGGDINPLLNGEYD